MVRFQSQRQQLGFQLEESEGMTAPNPQPFLATRQELSCDELCIPPSASSLPLPVGLQHQDKSRLATSHLCAPWVRPFPETWVSLQLSYLQSGTAKPETCVACRNGGRCIAYIRYTHNMRRPSEAGRCDFFNQLFFSKFTHNKMHPF